MSFARLNPRVLIVEEHRNMRSILRTVLRGFDIRNVEEAIEPKEALAVLESSAVDVVISEFVHAGGDTSAFIRKVRSFDTNPQRFVPVIVCTASTTLSDIRAIINSGADEILQKPISATQVIKRLSTVMTKRRPFVRTPSYFGPDRRRSSSDFEGADKRKAEPPALIEAPDIGRLREMMRAHFAQMAEF